MTFVTYLQQCWLAMLITVVVGYLLGSINTAIIVTRVHSGTDIRDFGSGNAGATNVLRSQGVGPAAITMAGDLLKSIASVLVGYLAFCYLVADPLLPMNTTIGRYLGGFCCLIGHLFPLFFQFRGGKGVVVSLGLLLILDWRVALTALVVFGITVGIWGMVSLGSVVAGLFSIAATAFFEWYDKSGRFSLLFCTLAITVIVIIVILKHIPNIKRILNGTEKAILKK